MSDLYRSAIAARVAQLPATLPPSLEDEEGDEEGDGIGDLPTGLGPPAMPAMSARRKKRLPDAAYAPISAADFFTQAVQVAIPPSSLDMRVYYTPPSLPADGSRKDRGSVLVCHHGAGYSALSFACFAREVAQMTRGELGVLALDARAHGKTTPTEGTQSWTADLSIAVLVADLCNVLRAIFPESSSAPSFILVGHSMGGAVTARACPVLQESGYTISGIAVLDVVEGSALEALPHMNSILNARPDGFDSVEEAVAWHVRTNTIRNLASARVSVPSIVAKPERPTIAGPEYVWRTPLRSTAPYWQCWFEGLSAAFLAARTARLLILAGTDRLDKELTIGQMRGQFQMAVVPGTGHMLHEDDPIRLAELLTEFWRRNERLPINVKKVGEL